MGANQAILQQDALVLAIQNVLAKHLPGYHDQKKHAGDINRVLDVEVMREDTEVSWSRMGLKRPADDELRAAFAIEGMSIRLFVTQTDDGLYIKGSEHRGKPPFEHYALVFGREIKAGISGPEIHHIEFMLPVNKQSKGLGAKLLERSEKWYQRIGIKAIRLTANSSVGRYAWARMGFDFADENSRVTVVNKFYDYLAYRGIPYDLQPILTHSWEIAAYRSENPNVSGKDFLLGHLPDAYSTIKRLDDDDIGYQIGQAYYAARNK